MQCWLSLCLFSPFSVLCHRKEVRGEIQASQAGCIWERIRHSSGADPGRAAYIQDVLKGACSMLFCKILHRRLRTSFPALMQVLICPIHCNPTLKSQNLMVFLHLAYNTSADTTAEQLYVRPYLTESCCSCANRFDNQSAHIQNGRCSTLMAACMLPRKRC